MKSKTFWIIFAIAAALRIALVWQAPLWYDENFSLIVSRLPVDLSWQAILGDVHPPLYYLLIRPIAQLSSIPWLIRLPSIAFSLGAIFLAWRIFNEWKIPERVQIVALALMTALPFQIYFAQEARMYALLEFLVLLAAYDFIKGKWIHLTVTCILILYTQNYGLFYVATIGLLVLLNNIAILDVPSGKITLNWRSISSVITPVILWLPWVIVLLQQMQNITGKYWITAVFTSPASLLNIFLQLFLGGSSPGELVPLAWFVTFAALIIGLAYLFAKRYDHWLSLLLLALLPFTLAIIASLAWQPVMLYRPLIGVTPFLILLVSYPIELLGDFKLVDRRAIYLACFIFPVVIISAKSYYQYNPEQKGGPHPNITDGLAYVRAHWEPGDIIVHTSDGSLINLWIYAQGMPQYKLPDCGHEIGSLSDQTRQALGIPDISLNEILNRTGRTWVIAQATPLDAACFSNQIAPLTQGKAIFPMDDNQFITSGIWLDSHITPSNH